MCHTKYREQGMFAKLLVARMQHFKFRHYVATKTLFQLPGEVDRPCGVVRSLLLHTERRGAECELQSSQPWSILRTWVYGWILWAYMTVSNLRTTDFHFSQMSAHPISLAGVFPWSEESRWLFSVPVVWSTVFSSAACSSLLPGTFPEMCLGFEGWLPWYWHEKKAASP